MLVDCAYIFGVNAILNPFIEEANDENTPALIAILNAFVSILTFNRS